MELPDFIIRKKIKEFLEEDIGFGDITTNIVVGKAGKRGKGKIFTRQAGVVAGLKEASILFEFFPTFLHPLLIRV